MPTWERKLTSGTHNGSHKTNRSRSIRIKSSRTSGGTSSETNLCFLRNSLDVRSRASSRSHLYLRGCSTLCHAGASAAAAALPCPFFVDCEGLTRDLARVVRLAILVKTVHAKTAYT